MKTIIEMAHEAGGILLSDSEIFGLGFEFEIYQLEAFATLVRADEREACMKEADKLRNRFAHLLRPPIVLAVGCFLFAYIVGWV